MRLEAQKIANVVLVSSSLLLAFVAPALGAVRSVDWDSSTFPTGTTTNPVTFSFEVRTSESGEYVSFAPAWWNYGGFQPYAMHTEQCFPIPQNVTTTVTWTADQAEKAVKTFGVLFHSSSACTSYNAVYWPDYPDTEPAWTVVRPDECEECATSTETEVDYTMEHVAVFGIAIAIMLLGTLTAMFLLREMRS